MRITINYIVCLALFACVIFICKGCSEDSENDMSEELIKAADYSEIVYGPGLQSFKIKAGETNGHWIKIENGASMKIYASQDGRSNYNIVLKDGSSYGMYQDLPISFTEGFYIDAISDSHILIKVY